MCKCNKGFSLIELILVMLLVAVVSAGVGIVVSNFSTSEKNLYQAGERLYSQMRFAQEEALVSQRLIGLRIDTENDDVESGLESGEPKGYSWHYYKNKQWHIFDEPLVSVKLDDDIDLVLSVDDILLEALQEKQLNNLEQDETLPPAIIFFPHGEISQFEMEFLLNRDDGDKEGIFRIYLDERGELQNSLLDEQEKE